jgi:hypothetical protein
MEGLRFSRRKALLGGLLASVSITLVLGVQWRHAHAARRAEGARPRDLTHREGRGTSDGARAAAPPPAGASASAHRRARRRSRACARRHSREARRARERPRVQRGRARRGRRRRGGHHPSDEPVGRGRAPRRDRRGGDVRVGEGPAHRRGRGAAEPPRVDRPAREGRVVDRGWPARGRSRSRRGCKSPETGGFHGGRARYARLSAARPRRRRSWLPSRGRRGPRRARRVDRGAPRCLLSGPRGDHGHRARRRHLSRRRPELSAHRDQARARRGLRGLRGRRRRRPPVGARHAHERARVRERHVGRRVGHSGRCDANRHTRERRSAGPHGGQLRVRRWPRLVARGGDISSVSTTRRSSSPGTPIRSRIRPRARPPSTAPAPRPSRAAPTRTTSCSRRSSPRASCSPRRSARSSEDPRCFVRSWAPMATLARPTRERATRASPTRGPRALVPRRGLPVLRLTRSGRALSAEEALVLSGSCGTGMGAGYTRGPALSREVLLRIAKDPDVAGIVRKRAAPARGPRPRALKILPADSEGVTSHALEHPSRLGREPEEGAPREVSEPALDGARRHPRRHEAAIDPWVTVRPRQQVPVGLAEVRRVGALCRRSGGARRSARGWPRPCRSTWCSRRFVPTPWGGIGPGGLTRVLALEHVVRAKIRGKRGRTRRSRWPCGAWSRR